MNNTDNNKLVIILVALVGAGILYWLYKKGKMPTTESADDGVSGSLAISGDKDLKQLIYVFKTVTDGAKDLNWILDDMKNFLNGTRQVPEENLINGRVTPIGAFQSAYGASYYPKNPKGGAEMHQKFHQMKNFIELGV